MKTSNNTPANTQGEQHDNLLKIFREHGGAYGDGIEYAYTMVHKAPQAASNPHEVKQG